MVPGIGKISVPGQQSIAGAHGKSLIHDPIQDIGELGLVRGGVNAHCFLPAESRSDEGARA